MNRSTIAKSEHKRTNPKRAGRKSISIDNSKLNKFCRLYSMNTPRETVCKELKFKQAMYYRYIDAAEEIVDDFLLGMVDHGLVLQFRTTLLRVAKRAEKLDELVEDVLDNYTTLDIKERNVANRLIQNANATDKLHSEMLDDVKIVNQTVKTLNKVIVKSREKKV